MKEIKEVPESSKILAEYGWYLPFDFHPAVINRTVDELKSGNSDVIDKLMVEYFMIKSKEFKTV